MNAKDILHKLNASCFDKLMLADEVVQGDVKLEEGQKDVKLSLLRVDMGVLSGLNEVQVKMLEDFGAVQEAPAGLGCGRCLLIGKSDSESFSGGGFGGKETEHMVLLLPDGRILAKYHHSSDYMEHSGSYDGSWQWQIAEGSVTPAEPGLLEITWTAWAELRHHTREPFGPGDITGQWEQKLLDVERMRGPFILVPTDHGRLSVPSLVEKWAKEGTGGLACARTKSVRSKKPMPMPKISAGVLKDLGMDPKHLPFWEK